MLLEFGIQKTASAKPKNFWQRTRFFSYSQRFPKVIIFRDCKSMKSSSGKVHLAWLHTLRSGKGPQLPGSNWKRLACSYSSSSSSLSWREVYTLSKVRRLALHSRPPIFSFHGFRTFCRSSSSMRQGPTHTTKYHNEKYTKLTSNTRK